MARNQLQKDIEVALSWFSFIPSDEAYEEDLEVFKRLKLYSEKDLGDFDTYTGKGGIEWMIKEKHKLLKTLLG